MLFAQIAPFVFEYEMHFPNMTGDHIYPPERAVEMQWTFYSSVRLPLYLLFVISCFFFSTCFDIRLMYIMYRYQKARPCFYLIGQGWPTVVLKSQSPACLSTEKANSSGVGFQYTGLEIVFARPVRS